MGHGYWWRRGQVIGVVVHKLAGGGQLAPGQHQGGRQTARVHPGRRNETAPAQQGCSGTEAWSTGADRVAGTIPEDTGGAATALQGARTGCCSGQGIAADGKG
jgi:hypothetical protein